MSALQWALLVFGALTIVAVYWYSRRDRRNMDSSWQPNAEDQALIPPADQQLDIFDGGRFDEYGVGKPRKVVMPLDDLPPSAAAEPSPLQNAAPGSDQPSAPLLAPAPPKPKAAPPTKTLEKLLSLLIAERDGNHIRGPAIHEALQACELEFGARKIYHRFYEGRPVFSVASLLKPGYLVPQQAEQFSTPGLAMFMVLPGPQNASDAIREMLMTAQRLAKMLNAEVYDAKRKLLSEPAAKALQTEVENWARLNLTT